MRILIVNRHYGSDHVPTGRMVNDLVRQIHRDGHDVTVLTSKSSYTETAVGHHGSKKARVIHVPTCGERFRLVSWTLFLIQASLMTAWLKWDRCVLLTDPPFLVAASLLANFRRNRAIYWWTMDLYPESLIAEGMIRPGGLLARFFRAINNTSIKRLTGVIALGDCQRRRLASYPSWPEDDSQFCLTQSPWDYRPIDRVERSENRFIASEGLAGKRILLYAGNLGRAHSYRELVSAARLMLERGETGWQFVFVCRGASRAGLEAEAADLSNVTILGYQPIELTADLLWSADIHAITMKPGWEGIVVPSKLYGVLQTSTPVLFIGPDDADTAVEIRKWNDGETLRENASAEQIVGSIQRMSGNSHSDRLARPKDDTRRISQFVVGLRIEAREHDSSESETPMRKAA